MARSSFKTETMAVSSCTLSRVNRVTCCLRFEKTPLHSCRRDAVDHTRLCEREKRKAEHVSQAQSKAVRKLCRSADGESSFAASNLASAGGHGGRAMDREIVDGKQARDCHA